MPPLEEDAPRLGEINRRLTDVARMVADFRSEVRGSFSELVRKDTYAAERDSMLQRISSLEARQNRVQGIGLTAIASFAVAILTFWITRAGT